MERAVRILQAEDEAISALQVELALRRLGYEVIPHVSTGEAAIGSARLNNPDIILMDIRLAGSMDGIEAAAAIRAESGTPVIFMTGYDDTETRSRAEQVDPLGYLVKPNVVAKLKQLLESFRGAAAESL